MRYENKIYYDMLMRRLEYKAINEEVDCARYKGYVIFEEDIKFVEWLEKLIKKVEKL